MYRLIYKSRSIVKLDQETVKDILHRSQDMNEKHQVSGALIATKTHFLQALEGSYDDVNKTFFRIVHDPRHEEIELVSFVPVSRRLFDGWTMKGFGIFDLNLELEDRLKKKYGDEEGGVKLPCEEWSALSLMHDIRIITDLTI